MIFPRYVYIKGRRLYKYGVYNSWQKAYRIAKHYQKRLHNNYFILKSESFGFGDLKCALYMNKVISLV